MHRLLKKGDHLCLLLITSLTIQCTFHTIATYKHVNPDVYSNKVKYKRKPNKDGAVCKHFVIMTGGWLISTKRRGGGAKVLSYNPPRNKSSRD